MSRPILIVADRTDTQGIESVCRDFSEILGEDPDFEIIEDKKIVGGFIAVVEGRVYDASYSSLLRSLSSSLTRNLDSDDVASSFEDVGELLLERLRETDVPMHIYDYGEVTSCADGIAHIRGLTGARYGELLDFDGGAVGLALNVDIRGVDAAVIDGDVYTSCAVHSTGRVAEICVGSDLLGRVVDPLGRPLDGEPLRVRKTRPIEANAPTIMQRSPVDTPLETGVLAIDSMIPIGRGQRELIIGDRQTGKTAIAMQAIINQSRRGVICVYCAIGQKTASVAAIAQKLKNAGALDKTVIVAATAGSSAAMQYIAPYAACAVAEEFMYAGRDALVVYDDLSKHAAAYRALSLLLRRPSGREAYPGDVFYLHSRLLERAAKLSRELGGGSLTALPIVETMANDITAYIPTNIISITDGQIYLESELFNAGQRPAVNVGLSVSRVGRAAQSKAMRGVSGALRLEVARYRDMAVFAQFGADIDAATAQQLRNGEKLMELLRQPDTDVLDVADQVCILSALYYGVFAKYDAKEVRAARDRLLGYFREQSAYLLQNISSNGVLSDGDKEDMEYQFSHFMREEENPGLDAEVQDARHE